MLHKLVFAGGQYALLAVFLFACWGVGDALLRWRATQRTRPSPLATPMAITLGLGVFLCALQALAIAGVLTKAPLLVLIGGGALLGAVAIVRQGRSPRTRLHPARCWKRQSNTEKCVTAALVLLAIPALLAPLSPPLAWDELAYHLPHAREWASSGQLTVNAWLRYPWFPSNYDLLFAGALVFGNDVLPHLLHAAAGWLVAWFIYRLGTLYLQDRVAAGLAAVFWLVLARSQFERAYVDMGATLFILAACIALQAWHGAREWRWVAIGAFCLGVAAGTKYQVLAFLPFFAVVLALRDRRPATWLVAAAALLLPCLYWYVRNAIATGDPFNPVGGRLFGFTDWNLADYKGQFDDLRDKAGWPHWVLWPACVVPFVPALRRRPAVRGACLFSLYMLVVWAATSRYPRYLMPAYPLLMLLAAAGWMHLARASNGLFASPHARQVAARSTAGLLLTCAVVASAAWSVRYRERIAPSPAAREALLRERVNGYGLWAYLREYPIGKLYQIGLEESLYYAPRPIWGDTFGPWRYRDYIELPPLELHRKLAGQGFEALAIDTASTPQVTSRPGFERYFIPVHAEGAVKLYRLAPKDAP